MYEPLDDETKLEFEMRLGWRHIISDNTELQQRVNNAIPERKYLVYSSQSLGKFYAGLLCLYLGRAQDAETYFKQPIEDIKTAIALCQDINVSLQHILFYLSVFLDSPEEANQAANVVWTLNSRFGKSDQQSDLMAAIAALWLGKEDQVERWLPAIRKNESKKGHPYVHEGYADAIVAILARDTDGFIKSIELALQKHRHRARYKSFGLNFYEFMDIISTLLTITALHYGIDAKHLLKNVRQVVKTRSESPADRKDLPSTKRFLVATDFVPDAFLNPWRHILNR